MTRQRVAIVTGGTRGIGKEISLTLARKGHKVISLFARNSKAAQVLVDEAAIENLDIHIIRGDLTREEKFKEVVQAVKEISPIIDTIIHSAASGVHRKAEELTLKHLRFTFEINVFSIHALFSELVPLMTEGGQIIGITSQGGTRVIPYYAAVGSSKGALDALFRHYAHELAPKNINVNLVCPGMILTEAVEAFPDKEERIKKCLDQTPTGKMTTVSDVAEMVLFLCLSRVGRQMVGETFTIDGGKSLLS